ncbi:MAG: PilN domain-containing protein [Deltaproteobacteria bacterium]|nr:PilN domain-containing protein [Deltaproteobacteria bacterium]
MLQVNLLPVREARRKADLRQYLMQLVLMLILTVGSIGLVHSRIGDQVERGQARVKQMQHDINEFKPQLEQVAAFKKRKGELEKKIDVIDGLDRARTGPVRVLNELSMRTPDRLWLTSLSTKGKTISLQGQSLDNELVALFLRSLGDSEYFANVDLDSTKLGAQKGGLKLVTFRIRAEIADPKGQAATSAKKTAKRA